MRKASALCASLLLSASPVAAQTQGHNVEVSAGLTNSRDAFLPGTLGVFRVGVAQRSGADRVLRARLDGEIVIAASEGVGAQNGLRAASITYGVLLDPSSAALAPYAIGGLGVTGFSAQGADGWPGITFSGRVGAGVRGTVRGAQLHAEVAMVSALAASAARGRIALWPITIGLAF